MIKVLFICHGNICRSPMAEFVMKDLVTKAGKRGAFEIASAAVSREELGNPVYPPAKRKLLEHGIRCDGHAARQMTRADYDKFDYIIGMDSSNRPGDVADPWYTGDFEETWRDVYEGCTALLKEISG